MKKITLLLSVCVGAALLASPVHADSKKKKRSKKNSEAEIVINTHPEVLEGIKNNPNEELISVNITPDGRHMSYVVRVKPEPIKSVTEGIDLSALNDSIPNVTPPPAPPAPIKVEEKKAEVVKVEAPQGYGKDESLEDFGVSTGARNNGAGASLELKGNYHLGNIRLKEPLLNRIDSLDVNAGLNIGSTNDRSALPGASLSARAYTKRGNVNGTIVRYGNKLFKNIDFSDMDQQSFAHVRFDRNRGLGTNSDFALGTGLELRLSKDPLNTRTITAISEFGKITSVQKGSMYLTGELQGEIQKCKTAMHNRVAACARAEAKLMAGLARTGYGLGGGLELRMGHSEDADLKDADRAPAYWYLNTGLNVGGHADLRDTDNSHHDVSVNMFTIGYKPSREAPNKKYKGKLLK